MRQHTPLQHPQTEMPLDEASDCDAVKGHFYHFLRHFLCKIQIFPGAGKNALTITGLP